MPYQLMKLLSIYLNFPSSKFKIIKYKFNMCHEVDVDAAGAWHMYYNNIDLPIY